MSTIDALGKPRLYKNILIYPAKMKMCDDFYDSIQCLMLAKNSIQDIEVLKMSYLQFLLRVARGDLEHFLHKLIKLLTLILQTENIKIRVTDKKKFELVVDDEHVISERDFEKIKTIISEQNLVDIDDEFINPEVKAKIDEARAFLSKRGNKMAGLDQQIVAYHCMSCLPYREIEELTIYQFQKGLARFDHILGAEAIMNARYSGMVEFKDEAKIPHWLGQIEDGKKDDGVRLDAEKFKEENKDLGKK